MIYRAAVLLTAGVVALLATECLAESLEAGADAPDFKATGIDGKEYTLKSVSANSEAVVVCFTCNQCPVAVGYEDRFIEFNKQFKEKGVTFIALNCNNQSENLEAMKQRAEEKGFNFVYAFDESGDAARAYGATRTPELYLIKDGKIAYHGSYDDKQIEPTKTYLVSAVTAVLAGETPEVTKTRAFGCGIRLKR